MRLSNTQLMAILGCVRNDSDNLPEGVSLSQYKNFKAVYDGDKTTPIYMNAFYVLASEYNFDMAKIKEALTELQDTEKPVSGGAIELKQPEKLSGKKFVFTSAQNNTDVHKLFLKTLESYCKLNDAELIIGQFVYNKNGFQNGVSDSEDIYYDMALTKYFNTEQHKIADGLVWCGELNILPTAKNPCTGFETYTGTDSSIIPHAKIALESVATPMSEDCKFMYATGAVTMHNYIQKKAGQLAQAAHCYGALVVELDDSGEWFARQIQTDTSGIFQDLNTLYFPDGKTAYATPHAVNWGDIHAEKSDFDVILACENMLDDVKPKFQLFHDTFDMQARNHHNRQGGHFLAKMYHSGNDSVRNDIIKASGVLQGFERDFCIGHVVESNHDLALESWLNANDYDFRKDPVNAGTYLALQSYIYDCLENGDTNINILEYALTSFIDVELDSINFLATDESMVLAGVECGMHGHIGCNGSRGSPQQFQKLNRPMNTGHTHTASIKGNVYTAGVTGSLDMGYNKGASSWSHSHIITYDNGFRTIVTMKNDGSGNYNFRA